MADLNEGTRQRNLRRLSGNAAVPSSNLREGSGTVVVRGTPTDIIQAMGGRIGGWTIQNGMLTADGGNVRLNSNVPSISLGAATGFATGAGIWEGNEGGVYKWRVGNPAGHLISWDGTTLNVNGTIAATSGSIGGWTIGTNSITADGGAAVISSNAPKITLGAASDFMTGQGVFMGKSGGSYSFHIGKPNGTPPLNYLAFDGATGALTLKGSVTTDSLNPALQSFTSNIVFSSTNWNTVSWAAGTVKLASGVTYSLTAGNTSAMAALTYIYLDIAVSTTALQTTTSYSSAMGDGKRVIAVAQNAVDSTKGGASVIPFGGGQPLINGNSQITASSILAGQIAAGAITASKISISDLAQIGSANIGSCHINSVLDIGVNGGIYQGSGTFQNPTTGLKIWSESSIGRLATYLNGTPQVYLDTSGTLNAGGGSVKFDNTGMTIAQGTGTANTIRWKSGGSVAGQMYVYTPGADMYGVFSVIGTGASLRSMMLLSATDGENSTYTSSITLSSGLTPSCEIKGNLSLVASSSATGSLTAAGPVKFTNGGEYSQIGLKGDLVSYWTNNAYWAGSQWNYVNPGAYSGQATMVQNHAGGFYFYTANNGANPVAWNNRLTIANNGLVTATSKIQTNDKFNVGGTDGVAGPVTLNIPGNTTGYLQSITVKGGIITAYTLNP